MRGPFAPGKMLLIKLDDHGSKNIDINAAPSSAYLIS